MRKKTKEMKSRTGMYKILYQLSKERHETCTVSWLLRFLWQEPKMMRRKKMIEWEQTYYSSFPFYYANLGNKMFHCYKTVR